MMMMLTYRLIIAIVFILFLYILTKIFKYIRYQYQMYLQLKQIPGPNSSIFFDKDFHKIFTSKHPFDDIYHLINRMSDEYGQDGLFCLLRIPLSYLIVTDFSIAQKLLNNDDFLNKSFEYRYFNHFILDNFNRRTLRQNKRQLLPYFRVQTLNNFLENSKKILKLLNENIDNCIDNNDGHYPDAGQITDSFIVDTIGENFFNTEFNTIRSGFKMTDWLEIVGEFIHTGINFTFHPLTYFQYYESLLFYSEKLSQLYQRFEIGIGQMITNRIEAIINDNEKEECKEQTANNNETMLDQMIRSRIIDGNITQMQEIRAQVNLIFLAGYDTTRTSLSWCLYLLGHHQSIQQRLYDEIQQFYDRLNSNDEEITISNMKQLKYLDCCIYETLRLYNPASLIGRSTCRSIQLSNGWHIPKGVNIIFLFRRINRDPKYFQQPEIFNPERFLMNNDDDRKEITIDRKRLAFFPFSSGIRSCIGKEYAMMQMRLFLINIIGRYKIQSLDQYGDAFQPLELFHPGAQFPIQFQRR
ncbi:Cytochrome P450 4V2 [Dermatophagoides pteronyssinus]|uniref:Cytochrome P450 4V2 n=1 Tax=Dermatophagoides pteronyssinus TaxID=6956 RepID=A0ABQ8JN77_DERPT|nr:Cytochrome P450 4V2 [Dermatophagoides pteronyssinus]